MKKQYLIATIGLILAGFGLATTMKILAHCRNFLVNNNTNFEDGIRQHLKQGAKVEVTSRNQTFGRLATKIEFETQNWDYGSDKPWNGKEFECEGIASDHDDTHHIFVMTRYENLTP